VGKIFLNFGGEKVLVALAVYTNGYCDNFFVLKDLVEDEFNEKKSYLMIPDVLNDKGLLGTNTEVYNFLSNSDKYCRYSSTVETEIFYEGLIDYNPNSLKRLIDANKQLEAR